MPALKMVPQTKDGERTFVYGDPYRCQCVYVGDQEAYGAYQRLVSDDFLDAVLSVPIL
jgi:hypothetical protein